MMRVTMAVALLVLLRSAPAAGQVTFSCAQLGRPGMSFPRHVALRGRVPDEGKLRVCEHCKRAAAAMVQKWIEEDRSNFERIANQFCSAELGWREHVPGTCGAGGPPPICRVDHWYRTDPAESRREFQAQSQEVARRREDLLIAAACDCDERELREADAAEQAPAEGGGRAPVGISSLGTPYGELSTPCVNGTCTLPGALCRGGYCEIPRPSSGLEQALSEGGGILADEVATEAVAEAVEKLSGAAAGIVRSFGFGVVTGVFEYSLANDNRGMYADQLRRLTAEANRLTALYPEFWRAQANRAPHRPSNLIEQEVSQSKARLRDLVTNLTFTHQAVLLQRDLGRYDCPNVFSYRHQQVARHVAALLALPDRIAGPR